MPGIRELWAALRASVLRRKKRRNLDDVEMREQSKSRVRAILHLQLNLPYILESNPRPFYSFRGLKKSDAD